MLYSVLEFGQYWEQSGIDCDATLSLVTPAFRFIYSFVQLYLIFVNAKVRPNKMQTCYLVKLGFVGLENLLFWFAIVPHAPVSSAGIVTEGFSFDLG